MSALGRRRSSEKPEGALLSKRATELKLYAPLKFGRNGTTVLRCLNSPPRDEGVAAVYPVNVVSDLIDLADATLREVGRWPDALQGARTAHHREDDVGRGLTDLKHRRECSPGRLTAQPPPKTTAIFWYVARASLTTVFESWCVQFTPAFLLLAIMSPEKPFVCTKLLRKFWLCFR